MSNPKAACEDARSRSVRSARRSGGSPDTASCGRTASPDWTNTSKKSVMHEERRNTNMPAKSKFARKSERELVTTHTFDAPRKLVWKAWTDPKLIPKWWGPSRYSTTVDKMDVRPGGRWRFVQRDAEGNEYGFHGEYREVVPPRRLVGTFEYEGMPGHVLVETATFEEVGGKTKLTQSSVFQNAEGREGRLASGMEEGAAETMERFTELVTEMQKQGAPGKAANRELVIVRVFDAPRALVWKAWAEPARLKRWWGPRTFTTPVAKIDLRVGGAFLYCIRQADGKDIWGTGVYREIVQLKRLVYTDRFADEKGNVVPATYYGMSRDFPLEMQVTVTFEDQDRKTKLTLHHVGIPAGPDRDGANQGWNESLDKLAEMLAAGSLENHGGMAGVRG